MYLVSMRNAMLNKTCFYLVQYCLKTYLNLDFENK